MTEMNRSTACLQRILLLIFLQFSPSLVKASRASLSLHSGSLLSGVSLSMVQMKVKRLERSHCGLTDLSRSGMTSVLSSGTL